MNNFFRKLFHLPGRRKKIGLALSSGGARGLAHIGVIKTLLENNIPIDYIAGSSSGSLVGGIYAATGDIKKTEEFFSDLTFINLIKLFTDIRLKSGLIKGEKITEFIDKSLGFIDFEDLKIPFCAVATDLISGELVKICSGNLAKAIRASTSIPLILQPEELNGRMLIDGCYCSPVPAKTVREMGADIVIAVNLNGFVEKPSDNNFSAIKIHTKGIDLLSFYLSKYNCQKADFVISPNLSYIEGYDVSKFINGKDVIDKGAEETKKQINKIKKYAGKI